MATLSIKEMLSSGFHFGHQTKRWNPKMKQYIYGAKNGIYIIDLQKSAPLFLEAYKFLVQTVARGEKVLFVGTKRQAQDIIKEEAHRSEMYHVTNRWLGGTLTNFTTIRKSIDRLKLIEKMSEDGTFERLAKKEVLKLQKEKDKLDRNLAGIKNMDRFPGAVVIVDPNKERIAVAEAHKFNIPIVSIIDTNCDPDGIEYLVPGNDDAILSIKLFVSKMADACAMGSARYQKILASRPKETKEVVKKKEGIKVGGPKVAFVSSKTHKSPKNKDVKPDAGAVAKEVAVPANEPADQKE